MRDKELRLALVCYGGVSLAVYMHGITKEVWNVARASRAFHDGDPAPRGGTRGVYHAMLGEIAAAAGIELRILADIVAGASAGGINGIFLAQAVSTGQSLDPLTDLWLSGADVEALIDPDAAPGSRLSKLWALPLAWMAAGRSVESVEALEEQSTREEVRAKLSHFVRSRWFEPPFGGATFTNLLLDAFDAMAASEAGPRLLPDGQPLDLFVTVTDFTGHPERLTLNSPPEVVETEHRLVISFSDHGDAGDSIAAIPELAFAARATSSFPGAFPPFSVGELDRALSEREVAWSSREAFLKRILPRQFSANQIDHAVLIDGSVLANAPFRPAIDALKERPAHREVDRRFVYIDPSPTSKSRLSSREGTPGFFQVILGSLSDLPRQQPIRDNLDHLAERSARIARMSGIVAALRPEVEAEIERVFGHTFFLDRPTTARLIAWRRRAQNAAAERAGFAYAAYGHLKLDSVVASITALLYHSAGKPGQGSWRRLRAAVEEELAGRNSDRGPTFSGKESAGTVAFLRTFDIGFRIRRLRLMARRLGEIEAAGDDAMPMREAIYASLAAYIECQRVDAHPAIASALRADTPDIPAALDRLAASLDLTGLDAATDERLAAGFAALERDARRTLLLAYLGFPYFDTATLPLLQGEGLDEFDPIKVDRISPDDAVSIRPGGAEATLKGIQFNSFGAFFSRAYRENDYLWGRLHGAERMIDIALSSLPARETLPPGRISALKRKAFLAILDEEAERLANVQPLISRLRTEIG